MAGITRPRQTNPARRAANPRERRIKRAEPAKRYYSTPPVMMRGTLQDMAVPKRKGSQPRHRHDLPLNFPGAEVRLPSVPALQVGWRVASAILVILMGLCLYVLMTNPAFQVEVVEVEGLQRLTLADIQSALSVAGEPIITIDPQRVFAELQAAFPELSSITVNVVMPDKVKVLIVERSPVIAWVQGGEETWIDQEGFGFLPRGEAGQLIRVEADVEFLTAAPASAEPLPSGELTAARTPVLPIEMVSKIQMMGRYVPEGAPILFSSEHGFGWTDPHGWQAYFGKNLDQVEQKLLIYQSLQQNLQDRGVEPSMISVEYLHAPFFRTER